MEHLHASRVFMGDSLAFHIIFVMFGLTLPVLVLWFEWWGAHKKDKKSVETAYLWSKIMSLLVVTGVISGTVIALQMSLVWPGILKFGGKVIGLPFMFETYAFLIEAVFLSLYMFTWNSKRVPRWLHLIFGVFVIIGSTLSAFAITSVNAWMNAPSGFHYVNGQIQNPNVWQAMFSQTSLIEFFHSMPGYYLASALFIASLYGVKLLRMKTTERRKPKQTFDWEIIKRLVFFSIICMVALVITADITGKYLARHEPVKFAAIELVHDTDNHLPFIFGGVPSRNGEIKGPYFVVPDGLTFLVGNEKADIRGISEYPESLRPPSYIRALFNIKLTLIGILIGGLVTFLVLAKWRPKWMSENLFLVPFVVVGFLGLVIMELGWMLTEIGRQPWAVTGYITTQEALTKTHDITAFGYVFPAAFILMLLLTILGVRKIVRDNTGKEVKL